MKNSKNIIILLVVAFIAIMGIAVMLLAPSIINNFSDVVGYAAHPVYSSFSAPESRFTINGNTLLISDYAIYKTGYYSINGGAWVPFTLSGTVLSGNWLTGNANANLPNFGTGENYVVIYSCTKNSDGTWNCHDGTTGRWQLQIINNTAISNTNSPTITFTSPTPNNAATITASSTEIKANITGDSNAISSWIDFDKSLIGYWSMDSYSSTGINDNSTYKNIGTYTGGLSSSDIVAGARGKGIKFNGVDNAISLPTSLGVAGRSDITLSVWTYFTDTTTAQAIYSNYIADGSWKFALNYGYNTANRLDVEYRNTYTTDSGSRLSFISSTDTPMNQWINIVVVYSASLGYSKIYMNGIEVGSTTNNIVPFTSTSSAGVLLGNDGDSYSPEGFSGTMDEVMIFSRALSTTEIKALYDSKINKFDATLTGLSNGQHTYTVYAIDDNGNSVNSGQRTLSVNEAVTCTSQYSSSCYNGNVYWYNSCGVREEIKTICNSSQNCTNNICVATITPPTGGIYVSPSGSDSNGDGSILKPYYSLETAWSHVNAGGTIYMRGGNYRYTDTINLEGKSGSSGNMINIWAYPGEHPVINYSGVAFTRQCFGIFLRNVNYLYFKGIRVTSIAQAYDGTYHYNQYGMILWSDVSNCIFEQMETDHIGGWGVVIGESSSNNLFLNCDSHHNADPGSEEDYSYGGADGFETGSQYSTNNIFRGCRAWGNSDDGWDLRQAAGLYTIDNCWAFHNGYREDQITPGGDGEGFKLGDSGFGGNQPAIRRVVTNSLSFENQAGVEATIDSGGSQYYIGVQIYNNIFYNNTVGINIQNPGSPQSVLKNNIIFANRNAYYMDQWILDQSNHNSLGNSGVSLSNSDFLSTDSSCMDDPRKADGSLPDCDFLKPSATSKAIGQGIAISGLTTDAAGNAWKNPPSLGAYERYP